MPKRLPEALRLPSSALIPDGGEGESCLKFFSVTPCLRGEFVLDLDPRKSVTALFTLELRRTLFQKRRDPFFLVFRGAGDGKQHGLQI